MKGNKNEWGRTTVWPGEEVKELVGCGVFYKECLGGLPCWSCWSSPVVVRRSDPDAVSK